MQTDFPGAGELEDEYEKEIKIVKVNALFSEELKNRYEVTVYPTILFSKKSADCKTGRNRKSGRTGSKD